MPTECSGPECDRSARYMNPPLCGSHYLQLWHGNALTPIRRYRQVKDGHKECSRCGLVLPVASFNTAAVGKIHPMCKDCQSIINRAQRYGIPFDAVKALLDSPCAGCGATDLGRNAHVDHDHDTGRVRGLLCNRCNTILMAHATPTILRRLADYLERS